MSVPTPPPLLPQLCDGGCLHDILMGCGLIGWLCVQPLVMEFTLPSTLAAGVDQ